jgi:hypothetical protein
MFSGHFVTYLFVFIYIPASNAFLLTSFLQYPPPDIAESIDKAAHPAKVEDFHGSLNP